MIFPGCFRLVFPVSETQEEGSARNELDVENNPKHFNKIKVKNINNINLKKLYCSGKNTMHLFLVNEKRKTNNKIFKKSKQNSVRKAALETKFKKW